ncbi:MAG TPA: hypothetical protein VF666_16015 [Pyrinomonadaceae bacterium]|jgi:anti-sigma-K factor RskA
MRRLDFDEEIKQLRAALDAEDPTLREQGLTEEQHSANESPPEDVLRDEPLLRRYLLGEPLPDEERRRVEKRFVADEAYAAWVELLADELTEDYLLGALTHDEADSFEKRFLSTPERVEIFRSMETVIEVAGRAESTTDNAGGEPDTWVNRYVRAALRRTKKRDKDKKPSDVKKK